MAFTAYSPRKVTAQIGYYLSGDKEYLSNLTSKIDVLSHMATDFQFNGHELVYNLEVAIAALTNRGSVINHYTDEKYGFSEGE